MRHVQTARYQHMVARNDKKTFAGLRLLVRYGSWGVQPLRPGTGLLSRGEAPLPLALTVFTAEFGMGSGVTPSLEAPGRNGRKKDLQGGFLGPPCAQMGTSCPRVRHEQYRL